MSTLTPAAPKATKKALLGFLRHQLQTNDRWVVQGLLRIFENQTEDEQHAHETRDHNGIGFTGIDAEFLSSCAESYKVKGYISNKRMVYVRQKMPKYATQLLAASDPAVLERAWRKSLAQPAQTELLLS